MGRTNLTKELLYEEYVVKEKPMYQIASEQGVAVGTVFNYALKFGIKGRRHLTETAKRKVSLAKKGKKTGKRRPMTEEQKRKLSEAKKGKFKIHTKYGGHKKIRNDGYTVVYCPSHPHSTTDGYVMEHILVMEEHIGRYVEKDEVVHHINHNRSDNRIENLKLMTFKEHAAFHMNERWGKKKGVMTYQ